MKDRNICSRCLMDKTVPGIKFDENGECNFCKIHDKLEKQFPLTKEGEKKLETLVKTIKNEGKGKEYDCIVGTSGGRDSTYTMVTAKKLGLRPLAVHFDNGWNSDIAVSNIKNSIEKLDVDLETWVADWDEFKKIQIAFLKASVSDAEIPTDYAIISVLYSIAKKVGVKYLLNGHSFRTEGLVPLGWTYMDGRYLKSVYNKFFNKKIKSIPVVSMFDLMKYSAFGYKYIPLLQYFDYHQEKVGDMLEKEVGWKYYGGHHHESNFTKFFQSFYLPHKFGIDKRKVEYSALVRSGQRTREDALKEIEENPYPYDKELVKYTISKLELTEREFEDIMKAPNKKFSDYPTYYPYIKAMKIPIKISCNIGVLPDIFYEKYFNY